MLKMMTFAAAALSLAASVSAATISTIDRANSGWYDSTGVNGYWTYGSANPNYLCGYADGVGTTRNYFVFDLSGASGTATAATLRLYNPGIAANGHDGYASPDAFEVYSVFDVSTPVTNVVNDLSNPATFTDLGSGTSFGAVTVTSASNGTWVEINLNAAGLSAVNASLGSEFAVGGSIPTLQPFPAADEYLFAYTNDDASRGAQLVITAVQVPEPTAAMALIAVGGMLFTRRTRA